MILITRTTTGLRIDRDATVIEIDQAAVSLALGPIISELIGEGRALAAARREGYELGLIDGRDRQRIERETSERIAALRAIDMLETLESVAYVPSV